jgi:hypothetical protein
MSEVRVVLSTLARIAIMLLLGWFLGLATSAPAHAISMSTWGFETGLLDPWTTFVTPNGSIGATDTVDIVPFDIDGPGPLAESLSVQLNVGQIVHLPGLEPAGGGIAYSAFFLAGDLSITADIATQNPIGIPNFSGGIFELLLDGIVQDSLDFDMLMGDETEFGQLSLSPLFISEGMHEIAILVTRPRENLGGAPTPLQYIDNITVMANVPEPQTLILLGTALLGLAALRSRQRRAI